jgi:phospholipid-binding lipoprotein MlaA
MLPVAPSVGRLLLCLVPIATEQFGNFCGNFRNRRDPVLRQITNFTNSLLQQKWKKAGITTARFVVNSTVGIAGLWDPASGWGLYRQQEDFGQTLGHYGVGTGAYVVLPVVGPSNLRDTTGLVVDTVAFTVIDPLNFDHNEAWEIPFNTGYIVDKRKRIPFRYHGTGSPFEYELVRMLNTQFRAFQVDD